MPTRFRQIIGDCRSVLPTLPAGSVHCCVTSPPYYGLRDYQTEGQLGLEQTPDAYVAEMVAVFRAVKRVLRKDGTLWLNLGDSYVSAPPGNKEPPKDVDGNYRRKMERQLGHGEDASRIYAKAKHSGLKPKDLIGIPWLLAFALRADGWYLRSDTIWAKPNPMPESATDRPTKAHEYLFLLAKSQHYFYDAEAIKERGVEPERQRNDRIGGANGHTVRHSPGGMIGATVFRNKRSVWTVPTQSFPEAHFATFPEDLIEPCIKAGTSEKGCCARCGAPWRRVVEKGAPDLAHQRACGGDAAGAYHGTATKDYAAAGAQNASEVKARILAGMREKITTGWSPSCVCHAEVVPGTVLDPFSGAGTTGLVADRLHRSAILIELNQAYADMGVRRLRDDRGPLFAKQYGALGVEQA